LTGTIDSCDEKKEIRMVSCRLTVTRLSTAIGLAVSLMCAIVPTGAAAQETSQPQNSQVQLDALFTRLLGVATEEEADTVTAKIWQVWLTAGDAETNRGMRQAVAAMKLQRYDIALAMLDKLIELAPRSSEAWNKRATVNYLIGRHDASLVDIEKTLALEPRHFGALSGRALILTERGDRDGAIEAMSSALKINPFVRGARTIIEKNGGTYNPGRGI
jgi:tetratricopeptide (TPR) repeat protein